ncbi:morphine 6-dehydrogenase (Naloxone reductase) [Xanthomonas oryzae pv. oryzae PXO99A]|uniref:Morphine 6-dehydrogenase (Naloxone reductase) n=1 Tax=Xanthomonas oryzae pv. oryzae (strain PXO99A) TaxID=360094 RepID=A0A0K0GMZ4_XANOP|nr:morphine 6-dehydrogenase (Naloxone reductase) [Xanthomonas oryzae pv. oryzae PXO99A]
MIAITESGTAAHVRANAAACGLQLDARDLAEMDRAFPAPKRKQPLDLR